ncbi:zf-TFIIB domain-containing protein [Mycobacterium intracellulare]|nr:zf-TFIIB domain-containing protein [Mycobacterium intracellulare]MCA2260955.1 zf-TFIIB domain-containing protein [Mycobacterium avium]MCA2343272.1 zf-TFIIB domain-containing protein [Mycobacterium intracellulare]
MICPRCGADMESYARAGVEINRCTGCRGVFLDRGNLEQLIDAETAYYQQQAPPAPPPPRYQPGYGQQAYNPPPSRPYYGDHDEHHGGHHGGYHGWRH